MTRPTTTFGWVEGLQRVKKRIVVYERPKQPEADLPVRHAIRPANWDLIKEERKKRRREAQAAKAQAKLAAQAAAAAAAKEAAKNAKARKSAAELASFL